MHIAGLGLGSEEAAEGDREIVGARAYVLGDRGARRWVGGYWIEHDEDLDGELGELACRVITRRSLQKCEYLSVSRVGRRGGTGLQKSLVIFSSPNRLNR